MLGGEKNPKGMEDGNSWEKFKLWGSLRPVKKWCFLGIFIESGCKAVFSLLYLTFSGKGSVKYICWKCAFQSRCCGRDVKNVLVTFIHLKKFTD